jgi:DNA-binding CsgD family transcriptional regulator
MALHYISPSAVSDGDASLARHGEAASIANGRKLSRRPQPETVQKKAPPPFFWTRMDKLLLNLHGSSDIEGFWKATQDLIEAAIPNCGLGITLKNNTPLTIANQANCQIPNSVFEARPFEHFFENQPGAKFVRASEIFDGRRQLTTSALYRNHMLPHKSGHAVVLLFWNRRTLACALTVMRTLRQGELDADEMLLLQRLYLHFQTTLHRLASTERDHAARSALQEVVRRLPLAMIVLRWDLRVAYQNPAAREFCSVWENGREHARVLKAAGPTPNTILQACRTLKERWRQRVHLPPADRHVEAEPVHCVTLPDLRALITLVQSASHGIARPHFLIECEDRHYEQQRPDAHPQLPCLTRLTPRERELTRLVCDGRSNQEIADNASMSLAMVKKHFHSIFHKLEVTSRAQLIVLMR